MYIHFITFSARKQKLNLSFIHRSLALVFNEFAQIHKYRPKSQALINQSTFFNLRIIADAFIKSNRTILGCHKYVASWPLGFSVYHFKSTIVNRNLEIPMKNLNCNEKKKRSKPQRVLCFFSSSIFLLSVFDSIR